MSNMNTAAAVGESMKAVVNTRYGSPDVLEIREVPKPEPKAGEVLVKVHATTVTRTDRGMLRADPFIVRFFFGLCRPKRTILGADFAGEVEAVGPGVTSFKPGQRGGQDVVLPLSEIVEVRRNLCRLGFRALVPNPPACDLVMDHRQHRPNVGDVVSMTSAICETPRLINVVSTIGRMIEPGSGSSTV
jgi:threonine dehydrogenase-like Zn-dependent dehydrogenase